MSVGSIAELGAMPAGMELQAQAGDRNPGRGRKRMDVFSSSDGIFPMEISDRLGTAALKKKF